MIGAAGEFVDGHVAAARDRLLSLPELKEVQVEYVRRAVEHPPGLTDELPHAHRLRSGVSQYPDQALDQEPQAVCFVQASAGVDPGGAFDGCLDVMIELDPKG